MSDRVLDLSEEPATLSVRYEQLVIAREGQPEVTVPLEDLAVLVVAHPQVRFSLAVLSGIVAKGGAFVVCNEKFLPVGMLLPIECHSTQAERFEIQAQAPLPLQKRLWQQIVKAKIVAQARLIARIRGDDKGILPLAGRVRSGDSGNAEAQASRLYWPALFGDLKFRRDRDAPGPNALLNYGYAILRAIVARAICAAGLHPSFGLHHHNRYDAFCLADDLMEPFRPMVDRAVAEICNARGLDARLDKAAKAGLFQAIYRRFPIEGESRTLFDIVNRSASSLAAAYFGQRKDLVLPDIW